MKELLDHGANTDDRNKEGETPLFQAVTRGEMTIISLLLAKGADSNTRNADGVLLICHAMSRGSHPSVIRALVDASANPELGAPRGEKALYTAVKEGDLTTINLLLSHGADPQA